MARGGIDGKFGIDMYTLLYLSLEGVGHRCVLNGKEMVEMMCS